MLHQYVQYQEVGSINEMLNTRLKVNSPKGKRSREQSQREYTKIKMGMNEDTTSQGGHGQTYSMDSKKSHHQNINVDYFFPLAIKSETDIRNKSPEYQYVDQSLG